MGTVGGDLCQRPRCWYFRQGFGLLAMKDGKSLVPNGENKYHAILGNSGPAYFVSASSLGPALIALGAKVKLVSARGAGKWRRRNSSSPRKNENSREIALLPNELLTEILVPAGGVAERHLRSAAEGGARLASGDGFGGAEDEGQLGSQRAASCWVTWRPRRGWRPKRRKMLAGKVADARKRRKRPAKRRWPARRRSARTATKCNWRAWR